MKGKQNLKTRGGNGGGEEERKRRRERKNDEKLPKWGRQNDNHRSQPRPENKQKQTRNLPQNHVGNK